MDIGKWREETDRKDTRYSRISIKTVIRYEGESKAATKVYCGIQLRNIKKVRMTNEEHYCRTNGDNEENTIEVLVGGK